MAIKAVIVDVQRTFTGSLVFLGCEQKMKRADRKDANSPMVPDTGKWSVSLMGKIEDAESGKVSRENFNVTIEAGVNPCANLEEFDKVLVQNLQYNVMTTERGQAMAFWRADSIRAAAPAAAGVNS